MNPPHLPSFFLSQEGPHSTLPEDEFFDAVEVGLDKIEEESQMRARLKLQQQQSQLDEQEQQQQLETKQNHTPVTSTSPVQSSNNNTKAIHSTSEDNSTTDNQGNTVQEQNGQQLERFGSGAGIKSHWLGAEIDRVCAEQLSYARQGVGEGGNGWQLFADEGEMKMYRREEEVNGMVIDPLKACHVVKGVSAREMCHYFYAPEFRNDWESEYSNIYL